MRGTSATGDGPNRCPQRLYRVGRRLAVQGGRQSRTADLTRRKMLHGDETPSQS
jgi:hypothetical protein